MRYRDVLFSLSFALSAHGALYVGPNGSFNNNTWDNAGNWSPSGVPSGTMDVTIEAGRRVSVNGGTIPSYAGDLTLEPGAIVELGINSTAADLDFALGSGTINMSNLSRLIMRTPVGNTNSTENLNISGLSELAIGTSTSSHGRNRIWSGTISGTGTLGIRTTNRQSLFLTASNTFSGGLYIGDNDGVGFGDNLSENNRAALVAQAPSALGTGVVQVGNGVNLRISSPNVMSPSQALIIAGDDSDQQGSRKLFLDEDLIVGSATIDGVALAPGSYDSTSGLLSSDGNPLIGGTGTLQVIPEPSSFGLLLIGGLLGLRRKRA
jgi:hypothetical protein